MSAVVVDLHCDTILDIHSGERRLDQRSAKGHIDLPRLKDGGVDVQVFAVYIAPKLAGRGPARARELIETFRGVMAANARQITHVTTVEGIERARREGKIAAVLSIENGDALGGDPKLLDEFYQHGVRMLGLTWNPSNALGDGALGRQHGGLTDLGWKLSRLTGGQSLPKVEAFIDRGLKRNATDRQTETVGKELPREEPADTQDGQGGGKTQLASHPQRDGLPIPPKNPE